MQYVALLRGINVGGKNKIAMADLRATFEGSGAREVRTYINSGNVIFEDDRESGDLAETLERAIKQDLGLTIPVLLRSRDDLKALVEGLPDTWVNDKTVRTEVLFLWDGAEHPDLLAELPLRDGIDEALHLPGAVIWHLDRENVNRSGLSRIVGRAVYKSMTMRNVNTVRKILDLMDGA